MKAFSKYESVADLQLVELCLRGDRDAFAQVVTRYQPVVCAITYSACGDLGRSQDLAQDTFVTAWSKLRELKEPGKLKAWLCGIARNLAHNSLRRDQRTPTSMAEELPEDAGADGTTPSEEAISREEEALMWRTLESLPAEYREPMVLYYRENQSAQAVAAALDLTEEAVRQRLSRGRTMLNERISKTVERTLLRSAPGKAFTIAVLVALPAMAVSASAATMGTTAVKGSATAKAAASLGLGSLLLGPLLGVLGTWLGYKLSIESAQSEEGRAFLRKFYGRLALYNIVFFIALALLACARRLDFEKSHPGIYSAVILTAVSAYALAMLVLVFQMRKARKGLRDQTLGYRSLQPGYEVEYRSKTTLLGLPLVHFYFGEAREKRVVKAWIAGGQVAVGALFAYGGLAIAPVSVGGASLGLFTLGGVCVGGLTLAGLGIGIWALGGTAIGIKAYGGCVVAWQWAAGGVAVAHHYALAGMAFAAHANDPAARTVIFADPFFHLSEWVMNSIVFLNLGSFAPIILVAWLLRRRRRIALAKTQN